MDMKQEGGVLTVHLAGEIDHCASLPLREAIEKRLKAPEIKRLLLDFSDVTFMDSSGIGMIIGRYKTMAARGGSVGASGLHPPVDRLFHMAGLHRIIDIEPAGRQEDA